MKTPNDIAPLAVTIQQAMALSSLSRQTIYNEMNAGNLRYKNVGRRRLVNRASLAALIGAE